MWSVSAIPADGCVQYPIPMGELGRMLIFLGGLLLVFGLVLVFARRMNLSIGRLPGDIVLSWQAIDQVYSCVAADIVMESFTQVNDYRIGYDNDYTYRRMAFGRNTSVLRFRF